MQCTVYADRLFNDESEVSKKASIIKPIISCDGSLWARMYTEEPWNLINSSNPGGLNFACKPTTKVSGGKKSTALVKYEREKQVTKLFYEHLPYLSTAEGFVEFLEMDAKLRTIKSEMCRRKANSHAISLGFDSASSRNKPVPIGLLGQPHTTAKRRKVSGIEKKQSGKKKQKKI